MLQSRCLSYFESILQHFFLVFRTCTLQLNLNRLKTATRSRCDGPCCLASATCHYCNGFWWRRRTSHFLFLLFHAPQHFFVFLFHLLSNQFLLLFFLQFFGTLWWTSHLLWHLLWCNIYTIIPIDFLVLMVFAWNLLVIQTIHMRWFLIIHMHLRLMSIVASGLDCGRWSFNLIYYGAIESRVDSC